MLLDDVDDDIVDTHLMADLWSIKLNKKKVINYVLSIIFRKIHMIRVGVGGIDIVMVTDWYDLNQTQH